MTRISVLTETKLADVTPGHRLLQIARVAEAVTGFLAER